jgi:hypothetical protein
MWKETAVTEPPGPSAPPVRQQRPAVTAGRFGGEFEVAKRHPLRALKVFALILFDVIAEIRHERKYRKEFEEQSPPLPAPSVSGSNVQNHGDPIRRRAVDRGQIVPHP